MAKEMVIQPYKCIGCSTCALTCSLWHHGVFDLALSNVRIGRDDFAGTFVLSFSSSCNGCHQCARVCPSGALQLTEVAEIAGQGTLGQGHDEAGRTVKERKVQGQ